jgi:hypothetical protein
MANLIGTTVTGDLAITGATTGQGAVPVGAVVPVVTALSGSHTIPSSGQVDAAGWQLCDGEAVPSSQTLSGNTPDLTDGRFLRGFTSSSGCGGAATFTLALGNLAAHDHGGATTSASTTPGATGACGQTTASTTPGATGGCGQTTSGCGQTTAACASTTGTFSANHTHTFTTGGQNCQHCHCICDAGTHSHGANRSLYRNAAHWGWGGYGRIGESAAGDGGTSLSTDSRYHCATYTCCVYNATPHLHSGTTATVSANHTHSIPSHTHTTPSHTHTTPSHTHTSAAHTHTTPSHTHTSAAHTHATTIASAGSGTAVGHLPIYFNVKYLIRVI